MFSQPFSEFKKIKIGLILWLNEVIPVPTASAQNWNL